MKPSTRTNAMRQALKVLADDCTSFAEEHTGLFYRGRTIQVTDAHRLAFRSLAEELRSRATGRRKPVRPSTPEEK